jgi:Mg2+-importing ATPase
MDVAALYERFASGPEGLSTEQAQVGLETHGPNVLAKDQRPGIATLLVHAVLNPIVILLVVLSSVSAATGDYRAASMMVVMILIGVGQKLFQEAKADNAAAKLKAMISVTATVLRDGKPRETRISQLVPGDVVVLAAGDMIPADVRLLAAKDLFVTQSSLTGESFPVEKFAIEKNPNATPPMELTSIALFVFDISSEFWFGSVLIFFVPFVSIFCWWILGAEQRSALLARPLCGFISRHAQTVQTLATTKACAIDFAAV